MCVCVSVCDKEKTKTLNTHVKFHTGAHLSIGQTPTYNTAMCYPPYCPSTVFPESYDVQRFLLQYLCFTAMLTPSLLVTK